MPRKRLDLKNRGRVYEWKMKESHKIVLPDGTELDMTDRRSLMRYYRLQLALNVEPTAAQLQRLDRIRELAESLPDEIDKIAARTEEPIENSVLRLEEARRRQRSGQ